MIVIGFAVRDNTTLGRIRDDGSFDAYLTPGQVRARTGLSTSTLWNLRKDPAHPEHIEGQHLKLAGLRDALVLTSALDAYITKIYGRARPGPQLSPRDPRRKKD